MKNKKIVDYIILDGNLPGLNLFERIESEKTEIYKEKDSLRKSIRDNNNQIKRYKNLLKEYQNFKKLEEGKKYNVTTMEEQAEWRALISNIKSFNHGAYAVTPVVHEFKHPLHKIGYNTGTIKFGEPYMQQDIKDYEEFKKSPELIKGEIEQYENSSIYAQNKIGTLKIELEKYKNNNPITNCNIDKPIFEIQVLELIKMGYEPLGGVSVNRNYSYQAMVKYED
ncbi:MAG: hypothetical protein COB98_01635 [Flavobacteriaceae bacterium]|nr:MAG: hypothetical protein COB98_01635 [Flavobacteriaceae bacterium]